MIKPFDEPIYVSRPHLPPLEEFTKDLAEIWNSRWLTNNGPVLLRFTRQLEEYLGTRNVCVFNNGTLALQIALQGMQLTGEAITTPFTFVATSHALYWNKIRPVFVDIEPDFYTLDPGRIESAITPWTTAIVAVHVFGQPCHLDELAAIARRHNLVLIYDAAHAFGVTVGGKSIAQYGDVSMFSFHATKPYHSIEGGLLTFQNPAFKKTFDYLKNFGFENETEVVMPGTNAKMNEFQALMGLHVLKRLGQLVAARRRVDETYRARLARIPGIKLQRQARAEVSCTYAYMPVEIMPDFPMSRDGLYERLKTFNVFARRYFYPLLTDFPCYRNLPRTDPLATAKGVAERILTLPIYDTLAVADVQRICDIIEQLAQERHS